jgi:hypothetical protein
MELPFCTFPYCRIPGLTELPAMSPSSVALYATQEDSHMISQDEALAELVSSRLTISQTRELSSIHTPSGLEMPAKLHSAEYRPNKSIRVLAVDTSIEAVLGDNFPPAPRNTMGVPGFPDFPDAWIGDDESWTAFCRVPAKANTVERRQRAEQIQKVHSSMVLRRLRRQAVNVVGLKAPRIKAGLEPFNNKHVKVHKIDRRKKVCQQLRHQRQMAVLRNSLKRMSCK